MAKIVPSALIQSMSGKLCGHSDTYFVTNAQTGRVHTGRICTDRVQSNTEAQIATRTAFAERSKKVKMWFDANKPSDSNPTGTDAYVAMRAKYKAQHKIGNFYGYVSKHIDELVDSAPSTTPSGSGSQTSGGSTSGGSGAPNLE